MNHYKIDWNRYSCESFPYALYVRSGWYCRWQHVASFRTVDEAKALHKKLTGLPIKLA